MTIALLIQTVQIDEAFRPIFRAGSAVILIAGIIIGGLGTTSMQTLPLLLVTLVLILAPVFFSLWLWIKRIAAADAVTTGDAVSTDVH